MVLAASTLKLQISYAQLLGFVCQETDKNSYWLHKQKKNIYIWILKKQRDDMLGKASVSLLIGLVKYQIYQVKSVPYKMCSIN